MEGFTDPGLLATIGGNGAVVALVMAWAKGKLKQRYGVDDDTPRDAAEMVDYRFAMNVIALGLAVAFALIGSAVAFPITPETNLVAWASRAFLIGLFGTLAAVGGENVTGNIRARM